MTMGLYALARQPPHPLRLPIVVALSVGGVFGFAWVRDLGMGVGGGPGV